jgi:hypothetical protein
MVASDDAGVGIEAGDQLLHDRQLIGRHRRCLVDHHHIGKLDLFDQQTHKTAPIVLPQRFPTIRKEILARIILQQVDGVDDRHHGVEPGDIAQRDASLVTKGKGRGDRKRLGNARAFDDQVIEPPRLRERAHFLQQIVAQGAADAAVGHLDQGFLAADSAASPPRTRSASIFTSDMSLTITATRHPRGWRGYG